MNTGPTLLLVLPTYDLKYCPFCCMYKERSEGSKKLKIMTNQHIAECVMVNKKLNFNLTDCNGPSVL